MSLVSVAFSANCRQSLSFSIDRWRGVCRSVIQVEAKLELSCVRHEAGMPWRIEHDFNMNFLDTGQPRELGLYVAFEHVAHTASGCRHGHLDMNALPALLHGHNHTRVNQTQIHNIDRNLRVVHGLQLVPDHLIAEIPFGDRWCLCRRRVGARGHPYRPPAGARTPAHNTHCHLAQSATVSPRLPGTSAHKDHAATSAIGCPAARGSAGSVLQPSYQRNLIE